MSITFEERIRKQEEQELSLEAARSYPANRLRDEADSKLRTPYQRDRDRIVHSKAFRRLKDKTQVFVLPQGDHYRTRLTHTLEATQVARTVARALRLNEDLTEAIGLGHDLGHPPFGHVGEEILDSCLNQRYKKRFKHNEHSLRVVDVVENSGAGLNLTEQVRDGILNHTSKTEPSKTLEGRIVRVVDRIAYLNHDIDDAIRAGVITKDSLPRKEIALLGGDSSSRISTLVEDLVEVSEQARDIVQSPDVGGAMMRLREFMFKNVYLAKPAQRQRGKIEQLLKKLFSYYAEDTDRIPVASYGRTDAERVTDYIAGMTDRFCVSAFEEIAVPKAFTL